MPSSGKFDRRFSPKLIENPYFRHYARRRVRSVLRGFRGDRILDVGGGTGLFAHFVREMKPDTEVTSIDVDHPALKLSSVPKKAVAGSAQLPFADTGEAPERGDPVAPAGEDTWLINAQYSERLNPRIFQIIREFLLTLPP